MPNLFLKCKLAGPFQVIRKVVDILHTCPNTAVLLLFELMNMNDRSCGVSDDVGCERTSWTEHVNHHIPGGRSGSSSTLSLCQSECVTNIECTGIDWVHTGSNQCWLHGRWSAGNQLNPYQAVDHYDLTRNANCNGKPDSHAHFTSLVVVLL